MVLVLLHLLGPSRFRGPGSFEPVTTGPALHGTSMSFPLPSTIAGLLASYAFFKGLCTPSTSSLSDWKDVEKCVEATFKDLGIELGDEWALRTGYILSKSVDGDRVYVHVEALPRYVELNKLIETVKSALPRYIDALRSYVLGNVKDAEEILERLQKELKEKLVKEEKTARRPKFVERIGISLERYIKVTRHGYLYTASDLDLHASFDFPHEIPLIATEIVNASIRNKKPISIPVRLSEGLPGLIDFSNGSVIKMIENAVDTSTGCYALIQLTPILLPEGLTPSRYEPLSLTAVMDKLLGNRCKVHLALGDVPYLARGRISVLVPGYSYSMDRYRSPQPAIIGTTICVVECSWKQAYKVYVEGVGEASRLGWGTLLPIPLPKDFCTHIYELRRLMG